MTFTSRRNLRGWWHLRKVAVEELFEEGDEARRRGGGGGKKRKDKETK